MWPDNETDRDFINFAGIAGTVAEIVVQANGRPISIGMSGSWGTGKSSMIKLTRESLSKRVRKESEREFIFVEFNAWLYQGYDDARAALMDVIASELKKQAEQRKKAVQKATSLVKRVDWLRAAKLGGGSAIALALGLPPTGLLGELVRLLIRTASEGPDQELLKEGEEKLGELGTQAAGLLKPKPQSSPPKEIEALRENFESTLEEMGVTLVVLIDDLDRCLPETTISTLEAIRLFLFLKNTAFVIAADNHMIKHAVKKHFTGVPDDLLMTNYFDKLIQVPIRVPPLGTQEVRAYMMLLFMENSGLDEWKQETVRAGIAQRLQQTWQGKRVDISYVKTIIPEIPSALMSKLETAERLAPLMTTAPGISGNPRLIKRFLNALSIRMAISRAQGVSVDEAVLAKLMLFERLGNPAAYKELVAAVSRSDTGVAAFLADMEDLAHQDPSNSFRAPWEDSFTKDWLLLPPQLGTTDLRGVLYVSREHSPLITAEDNLSSEGAGLLEALITHPDAADQLLARLTRVARTDTTIIMDRLLDRARAEQEWGVPGALRAMLAVVNADPAQGARVASFLADRPVQQVRANIVPKLIDFPWSKHVFDTWQASSELREPVRRAITAARNRGNLPVK